MPATSDVEACHGVKMSFGPTMHITLRKFYHECLQILHCPSPTTTYTRAKASSFFGTPKLVAQKPRLEETTLIIQVSSFKPGKFSRQNLILHQLGHLRARRLRSLSASNLKWSWGQDSSSGLGVLSSLAMIRPCPPSDQFCSGCCVGIPLVPPNPPTPSVLGWQQQRLGLTKVFCA